MLDLLEPLPLHVHLPSPNIRMRKNRASVQQEYFATVSYRDPLDSVVSAYAQPKLDFIGSHIPINGSALDVGCGHGAFTIRLKKSATTVVGVDTSLHLLSHNPHRTLICGDASALPFADESFDLVFEANLLHHVSNRKQVVKEMARVSRRHVVLLEPNRYNPVMFSFSLIVKAEHGGMKSCTRRLKSEVHEAGLRVVGHTVTGMISQNNTPAPLVPLLKRFDREIWWGEYVIVIAEKQ